MGAGNSENLLASRSGCRFLFDTGQFSPPGEQLRLVQHQRRVIGSISIVSLAQGEPMEEPGPSSSGFFVTGEQQC